MMLERRERGTGRGGNTLLVLSITLFVYVLFTSMKVPGDRSVKDFSLQNVDGKTVSTRDYKDAKGFVVIFTCLHCPFAKLYDERLNDLYIKYANQHIPVLLINSSDTLMFPNESLPKMAERAKEKKYKYPFLFDPSQAVAKEFAAEKTPHAFVIWKEHEQWVIKYSGAIDDNGAHASEVKAHFVTDALDQLLTGRAVNITSGKSIGCAIHYRN